MADMDAEAVAVMNVKVAVREIIAAWFDRLTFGGYLYFNPAVEEREDPDEAVVEVMALRTWAFFGAAADARPEHRDMAHSVLAALRDAGYDIVRSES